MAPLEWAEVILPERNPLELVARASLVYVVLFAMLRGLLKREPGSIGLTDLLVVVLLADAVGGGLTGDSDTVGDSLILAGTIIGWSYALEWLSFNVGVIGRLVHPPPLPLVLDGTVIESNLRKELLTRDELMSRLREEGYESLAEVRRVYMEGNGRLSVVPYANGERAPGTKPSS